MVFWMVLTLKDMEESALIPILNPMEAAMISTDLLEAILSPAEAAMTSMELLEAILMSMVLLEVAMM
jgi:hypothetical protein